MIHYELLGESIQDKTMLHRYLKQLFDFPEHYGHNLDAMVDLLSEPTKEQRLLIIRNQAQLKQNLGGYYDTFIRALKVVAKQPHFDLQLKKEDEKESSRCESSVF